MAKTAQDYTDERYAGYRGEAEQLREQRRQSDDAAIQQYNEAADRTAAAAKKPYESQLEQLPGEYQKMLDYNALQELVGQRQVAESMANMGLTDSGLNRTQQTALAVQRGNADAQVRLAQQRKTEELQEKIAQITESNAAQKIQQEAAVRSESDSWYNNLLADFYNRASQEGAALYDADRTRAAQAAENERQRQAALAQYEIQQRQAAESGLYSAIQNRAVKYDNPEDAKAYLERMVDLENIDPEDAAFIYQVYVGGTAADFVPEGDFPTTFEEFYEMTGSDASIMKKSEFERAKASGNSRVSEYTDYYDYLAKMYDKYKN